MIDQTKTDVQRATRFPVHMQVRYRVHGEEKWHEGRTENISRTGVLFWVDSLLEPDTPVEMDFTLPVKVGGQPPATIFCKGRIVRTVPVGARNSRPAIAATIHRFQFHRGSSGMRPIH
jgi:hypothetical protein